MAVDCRKCQRFDSCYYDYDENCVGFLPSSPQKLQREKQKAHANEILENYWKRKNSKLTNADRIRAMTDEELNNWITCPKERGERTIGNCMTNGCYKCKEDWLKQESTNES